MKRIFSFLLALSLIAVLSACNSSDNSITLETESTVIEASTPAPSPPPSPEPTVEATPELTPTPTLEAPALKIRYPSVSDRAIQQIDEINGLVYFADPTSDGNVCVFVINQGSKTVDELSVQIVYYDSSGTIIDTEKDGHDMILPGSTVVSRMDAPDEYSEIEIVSKPKFDIYPSYCNHAEKIDIQSNVGNKNVIIQITNNDSIEIREIEFDVVFYNGDTIESISFPHDVYDVTPGETVIEEVSTYGIEFDRYVVFLNQAHTFDNSDDGCGLIAVDTAFAFPSLSASDLSPTATLYPTSGSTSDTAGYSSPVFSIDDITDFPVEYFDLSSEIAPDDISDLINSRREELEVIETDNVYDFSMGLAGSRLHFLTGVALTDNSERFRFIQGAIPSDDAAPYFFATILHLHRGTSLEQSLSDSQELIAAVNVDSDSTPQRIDDGTYVIVFDSAGEYYYFEAGFKFAYDESDFYLDRLSSNRLSLLSFAILG